MIRTRTLLLLAALCVLGLSACGNQPAGWQDVALAELSDTQRAQADRATAARDLMFQRLFARLKAAVAEGGGVGAIAVCREDAPRIAQEVAQEAGLRIGRTSHRLRNPANVAPDWARTLIEQRADAPRYRVHPDGRLGALLPIPTAKRCLTCHGALESIAAPVRDALAENYPEDAATGFAEGDLRGWFWLEVPAKETH